jgi:hypothetical protein
LTTRQRRGKPRFFSGAFAPRDFRAGKSWTVRTGWDYGFVGCPVCDAAMTLALFGVMIVDDEQNTAVWWQR